jgi:hypothetical protein
MAFRHYNFQIEMEVILRKYNETIGETLLL